VRTAPAVLDGILNIYLVPTRQRGNAVRTAPAVLDGILNILPEDI
jgi:hypothetical protein